MASPFRVFRKNVKPMLAFFVVMLMLSWVIGDSLFNYFTGGRNPNPTNQQKARQTAVSWDGGKLTNLQLNDMVARRHYLNAFLTQLERQGAERALEAGVDPRPLHVQRLLGPDTFQEGVERSVVQTRLFADAARKAGMAVSDEAIVQYLDEIGRGNVTRSQMREILGRMQGGGRASIDEIMAALREEMLARNFVNSGQYSYETVTPEQRWRDWLRVNDRVIVEAAAIPTDKFLGDVKEPTDAELQAFFDKYKDQEPSPELAYGTTELPASKPGFKIPRKIDVQYIEANFESFVAKAEPTITDPEISEFYEKNKETMFPKLDTGLMEDTGAKKEPAAPENPATPGANEAPPAGENKPAEGAAPSADSNKPAGEAVPPSDAPKAPEGEAKPATDGAAAPSDQPPAATPPADAPKSDAQPAEGKQSSLHNRASKRVFHLTAFQDASKEEPATTEPAADNPTPPAAPPAEAASKATETPATPAAPATPATATEAPATAPPASSEVPAAATPAATEVPAAPGAPATPAAPAVKKPKEFQPLSEVKDQIRRHLAEQKVREQLTKLCSEIEGQLQGDYRKWFGDTLAAQEEKKEAPKPPQSLTDLTPLAEKNGLKAAKTGPMSVLQFRELPIGKSGVPDTGRMLITMLFGSKVLDMYEPTTTLDAENNYYVSMKISDTPAKVPTLAEVRDEVVKAWKFQKAAELAEKHAQEVAKKAEEAKTPLPQFFADDTSVKVTRTDPFAELTGGEVGFANGQLQQQPFRLSQPEGLTAAGPEFIRKIFELKDGQVMAMLNHDHTIAYVVRLVEHQMPVNELRTAYLGEANSWPGIDNMSRGHMQELWGSLQNDIVAGSNLKWERDPDKIEQSDTSDAG